MNLLLCFFVMLFSMSSVNEEKFEKVIASFRVHSAYSREAEHRSARVN
ncbi:MAG: flagellar motor protein MotB [Roseburia sp.]